MYNLNSNILDIVCKVKLGSPTRDDDESNRSREGTKVGLAGAKAPLGVGEIIFHATKNLLVSIFLYLN